jgi:hypothetical protein
LRGLLTYDGIGHEMMTSSTMGMSDCLGFLMGVTSGLKGFVFLFFPSVGFLGVTSELKGLVFLFFSSVGYLVTSGLKGVMLLILPFCGVLTYLVRVSS